VLENWSNGVKEYWSFGEPERWKKILSAWAIEANPSLNNLITQLLNYPMLITQHPNNE
jgi:hypothetical protein